MAPEANRASFPPVLPRVSTASLILLGFGALFSSASCGPTCPGNEPNCGTSNPGAAGAGAGTSNAGAAGGGAGGSDDASPTTCAPLTALRTCMDAFCAQASNPFCTCYKRGYDIRSDTCACSKFNAAAFCKQAADNGVDATTYDCSAATGSVATVCVGVQ